MLKDRDDPKFLFDPGAIGQLFNPFGRVLPNHDWIPVESRVIAPVPDKTEGLKAEFVRWVYRRSETLLRSSTLPLIAIGYSFNRHDRESYGSLLSALESGSASVLLVSPDAEDIRERIAVEFPKIDFEPLAQSLRSWADVGFPGLQ